MAFSGIAALMAAETVTVPLVLAAVANVGMITTVVGAVTGNKSLMQIGGAMSLVGGIGGALNGLASEGAEAAAGTAIDGVVDQSAAESARLGIDASGNAIDGTATSAIATPTVDVTNGLADTASGASNAAAQGAAAPIDASGNALGSGTYGNTPAVDQLGSQTGMPGSTTPSGAGAPTGANAPADLTGASAPTGPSDVTGATAPNSPYNAGVDSQAAYNAMPGSGLSQSAMAPQSYWGKLQEWYKANPKLGDNIIKLGSNVLTGIQQQSNADRDYELKQNQFNMQNNALQNSGKWALPSTGILGQAKAKG